MGIFYSPLRYPGGKNCIFPFVSRLFYENQMVGIHYAEPYAGGAGLALRLLCEGYVEKIYINDLDRSIYAFWSSLIGRTDEFCSWVDSVDISIENWNKYRKIQDLKDDFDDFELAKSTFFLNRTNVSGIIKGGVIGGQNQRGKYKIDARFNKYDLIKRIKKIASLKDRIAISNLDGLVFVNTLNKKSDEIFIYLDPPYYQKGADLYMNFYLNKNHEDLSRKIRKITKKWMISYDKQDFILNLYNQYRIISYSLSQSASNRVGEEILIFSESMDFYDSIINLKNHNFIQNQLFLP